MKKFNALLKSEIRKVETLANRITGFDDCKITAYSIHESLMLDDDINSRWIDCKCEICRNYEETVDIDINISIPMFDRRMSWAYAVIDGKLIK